MKRDTILHVAARSGEAHLATLQKVLNEERLNIDARNELNQTPLHVAASYGNGQACELLIRHGAHIFLTGDDGLSAIHLATRNNHVASVSVLLKYGCNPYMPDARARSAISFVSSAAMAECYLNFFSTVRRNPTLLQRLEKDLLWQDISDLLDRSSTYDAFPYEERPERSEVLESPKCGSPVLNFMFPAAYSQLNQVRS
jgi:hypothetical protein